MASDQDTLHADLSELLTILGMGDHARPQSPHAVFQEALEVLRKRLAPPNEPDITQAMIQAASYDETFNAIAKAVTVHSGGALSISVKAFYRALSYPDQVPASSCSQQPTAPSDQDHPERSDG